MKSFSTFLFLLILTTNNFLKAGDIEILDVLPGNPRAESGIFSDAEYIMATRPVIISVILFNSNPTDSINANINIKVYQENNPGEFDIEVVNITKTKTIPPGDTTIIWSFQFSPEENSFNPKTYFEISEVDSNYYIPPHFESMKYNVTPVHKIEINVVDSESNEQISSGKEVRFFIKRGDVIASGKCLDVKINSNSSKDSIAAKLNFDNLNLGFRNIGFNRDYGSDVCDVLDRDRWPVNSVDYSEYRFLFWSDGDENPISVSERADITRFVESGPYGSSEGRVGVFIASQEMARIHGRPGEHYDRAFCVELFRTKYAPPGNPLGKGNTADEIMMIGHRIGRDLEYFIEPTGFEGDQPPYCGLVEVFQEGMGVAQDAFIYTEVVDSAESVSAGTAVDNLMYRSIYIGVDWRHFYDSGRILRYSFDFLDQKEIPQWTRISFPYPRDSITINHGESFDIKFHAHEVYGPGLSNIEIFIKDYLEPDSIRSATTNSNGDGVYTTKVPDDFTKSMYPIAFGFGDDFGYQEHFNIYVYIGTTAIITDVNDTACVGTFRRYTASGEGRSFEWEAANGGFIVGESDKSFVDVNWYQPGVGRLSVKQTIDSTGWVNNRDYSIQVIEAPSKPSITRRSDTLFSSYPAGNQWYINKYLFRGRTGQYLVPDRKSSYSVAAVNDNSCASELSDEYYFVSGEIAGRTFACNESVYEYSAFGFYGPNEWTVIAGGEIIGPENEEAVEVLWNKVGDGKLRLIQTLDSTGAKDQKEIDVNILALPPKPTITEKERTLYSSWPSNNQWYYYGERLAGHRKQQYVPTKAGIYSVEARNNNYCTKMSDEYYYNFITSVENEEAVSAFSIYPNPSSDIVNIDYFMLDPGEVEVHIYNSMGTAVISQVDNSTGEGRQSISINIRDLSQGLYLLTLRVGDSIRAENFLKID